MLLLNGIPMLVYSLFTKNGLSKKDSYNIKDGVQESDEYYTMDYSRLSPYFIEAIKELKEKNEALEARIKEFEG